MKAPRRDLVDPKITEHEGPIVDIRRGERRERVVAPRNSQDFALCRRATSVPFSSLARLRRQPGRQQEAVALLAY
jgi:hypothetical protein